MERKTFLYTDPNGIIREVDEATGEVVAQSASLSNMELDANLPISQEDRYLAQRALHYNPLVGDFICQKIIEGMNLTAVCKLPGVPCYAVMARWRAQHPEFHAQLTAARRMKAELLEAQVEDSLDGDLTATKEEVPGRTLWFKKQAFLIKTHNPELLGDGGGARSGGNTTIIIDTGIRRDEPIEPAIDTTCTQQGDDDGREGNG